MIEAETMSEFLTAIQDTSACVRINIHDIPQSVEGINNTLITQGHNPNRVTSLFFENLRALCPDCCVWIPPETLSGVHITNNLGRQNVTFTNYGPQAHLLNGRCVLDRCSCQEVVLVWRGPEPLRSQVMTHINRIRQDAQDREEIAKIECLNNLSARTVVDFTIDTIWALRKNATDRHVYLGRGFPCFSESPNLFVWVSVIPYSKEVARAVFPGGYAAFLGQILDESGLQAGGVSVAHWISMGDTSTTSLLNLALASRLDLPKDEKFLILPSEVCVEEEKERKIE